MAKLLTGWIPQDLNDVKVRPYSMEQQSHTQLIVGWNYVS